MQNGGDHDAAEKAHSELFDTTAAPSADLTLKLDLLTLPTAHGKRRAKAKATLMYVPPTQGGPNVQSSPYDFTAPLGPIEGEELRWYLERYAHWPVGVFAERADKVVNNLPEWGADLFEAALRPDEAREAYEAWQRVGDDTVRRFNMEVDPAFPEGKF